MVNIYIPYEGGSAIYESVDFFQFQKRFAAEPICLSNGGPMVLFVLGVITISVCIQSWYEFIEGSK